jgi:hypothetical protein
MDKVCVFCGNKPESKTLEHVLPNWLISLTGDPKRQAKLGFYQTQDGKMVNRLFAFDQFKFPACDKCNQRFSELEGDTKNIIERILTDDSLSESSFTTLLDWFDKVRIGLWLGFRYLDGNRYGVNPQFHISKRLGHDDRLVFIYKSKKERDFLGFLGCDTPAFNFSPSCFSLIINNYFFLNMSFQFFLSRRLGFPYPPVVFRHENGMVSSVLLPGRENIMRPVLKKLTGLFGTEIYQPIIVNSVDGRHKLYDTDYVRNHCISWENGIGRIFFDTGTKTNLYPNHFSTEWIPPKIYDFYELFFRMEITTLNMQLYLYTLSPSIEYVSPKFRKTVSNNRRLAVTFNNKLVESMILKWRSGKISQ